MRRTTWSVVYTSSGVVHMVSSFGTEPEAEAKMETVFENLKKRRDVPDDITLEEYNEGSHTLEVVDSTHETNELPSPEHAQAICDRDDLLLFLKWYFGEGRREIDVIIGGVDGYGSKNESVSYPDELDAQGLIAFLAELTTIMTATSNLRGILHSRTVDMSDVEDEDSTLSEDKTDDVPF